VDEENSSNSHKSGIRSINSNNVPGNIGISLLNESLFKSNQNGNYTNITSTSYSNRLKEDSILIEAKEGVEGVDSSEVEQSNRNISSKFFNTIKTLEKVSGNESINNSSNADNNSKLNGNALKEYLKSILEKGNTHRHRANVLFKKNKFKDALNEYSKAIEQLNYLKIKNEREYPEILNITNINWIRMECLNNIAVCSLVLKDYEKALEYSDEVN
jgi:tetratricopeptide (TPR) repeat protein